MVPVFENENFRKPRINEPVDNFNLHLSRKWENNDVSDDNSAIGCNNLEAVGLGGTSIFEHGGSNKREKTHHGENIEHDPRKTIKKLMDEKGRIERENSETLFITDSSHFREMSLNSTLFKIKYLIQ